MQTQHQIDWDSATCITYSTDYYQRFTLESWFTNLEQTPLNRSQQLAAPYKRLIARLHVTSRPPCLWSRTKAFLSSGN